MTNCCATNAASNRRWLGLVAVALLLRSAAAQTLRGIEITAAAANEVVAVQAPNLHGVVPMRGGAWFVLVTRSVFAGPGCTGAATSDLELWRSDDAGLSWRKGGAMPTADDQDGALAPDGDQVACLWSSRNGSAWGNVYWQRFDPKAEAWIGTPTQLATGTGDEDQYFANDLVRLGGGAMVAAIGSHRYPKAPWTCGWSTAVRMLAPGATEWSDVTQANVASYGCSGTLFARGGRVDVTYRTNPGEAIHGLRTFDAATGAFVQATDECAMAPPCEGSLILNTGVLCGDDLGGRTLLHVLGDRAPGKGRLAVSFAKADGAWHTVDLVADAPLFAGNENPRHYALARGPGNQVVAWFAKADEQFARLWQCVLEDGVAATAPRCVATGANGAFRQLNGMRVAEAFSSLGVVAGAPDAQHAGGVVTAYGAFPAKTVWTVREAGR